MTFTKQHNYNDLEYGDIVRCTAEVQGSKGKRYKFLGAIFGPDDAETPLHLDLVDIRTGATRAIRPQYVVKDAAPTKAARARKAKKSK